MKQIHVYLMGATMITASAIFSAGCSKSTDSDEDLIGNWKRADDFEGNARGEAVSFTIGDYAYVSTGSTITERFKDLWEYNLSRRYWTQMAELPGNARNSAVAFAIGAKGYVGTGYDGVSRLNDFWEYDQTANAWSRKADFGGTARYDAVAFAVDGKGYIACGYDGNYLKDVWEFTPGATAGDAGSWTQKASVGGSKRRAAQAFVVNGVAYICSGNNNGELLTDLWSFNATANEWTEKNKIYDYTDDSFDDDYSGIARYNGTTVVMGNYVYLTTGYSSSLTSTTWRYDPANDRWLQKTGFEGAAREGAVSFTLNNRGFVLTGISGSDVKDNAYEFLPDAEQVDND